MVKYCPKCDNLMPGDYCSKCGTELEELIRCEHCHETLCPTDNYCSYCGKKREKVK